MNTLSRVSLLVVSSLVVGVTMFTPALARDGNDDRRANSRDVKLVNGKIHTLDARNSIVSSVTIKNGKFAVVGDEGQSDGGPCMSVINLGGRTAVPGLVDNHNHFLLLGLRPGHDTRLETATSIADVQAAIRARTRTVPAGAFITAMGGWTQAQFAENRLPTLAEFGFRRAQQSGAHVQFVHRAGGDQYAGKGLLHRQRRRGGRGRQYRRECALARCVERLTCDFRLLTTKSRERSTRWRIRPASA